MTATSSAPSPDPPAAAAADPRSSSSRERRRSLIAAFAIFHVVACCVAALPDLEIQKDRKLWQDDRVKEELAAWAEPLGTTGPELEDALVKAADIWQGARDVIVVPFEPYLKATGLTQSWPVFVAGTRHASRFEVVARDSSGAPRRLYLRADPSAQWQARLIESPSWRSATFAAGWPNRGRWRQRMCHLLAQRAFAEADADAAAGDGSSSTASIECAVLRRRYAKPGEPELAEETRERVVEIVRGQKVR